MNMSEVKARLKAQNPKRRLVLCLMLGLTLLAPVSSFADKKEKEADEPKKIPVIDYSNIVWPNPPAIARIRYQAFYSAEKISQVEAENSTKKAKWMDRLAGTQPQSESGKVLWQLAEPYGMAVDSKNNLYVADQKVGAIFIFNTETRDLEHDQEQDPRPLCAHYWISDGRRRPPLRFRSRPASYSGIRFHPQGGRRDHRGMVSQPTWPSIARTACSMFPTSNLDQVLVYDADSLKLKRKIGTTGHNHELTTPAISPSRPGWRSMRKAISTSATP
jgi:hypothetical protein